MATTYVHLWQPAAWIEVTGEDSFPFLQGQFTNDLRDGGCRYGLWLDRKGKIQADSFVLCVADERFFIASYYSPSSAIIARLEPFVIADDVAFTDATDKVAALSLWGPEAGDLLNAEGIALEKNLSVHSDFTVFSGRRSQEQSFEWVFYGENAPEKANQLHGRLVRGGAATAETLECERARLASGIPAIPLDTGHKDLPQEAGLEESAISFNKGCYLGQEVMARIQAMGNVRRQLVRISTDLNEEIPLPAPAFDDGHEVGEVRALHQTQPRIGLAMIRKTAAKPGSSFALAPDAAPSIQILD